MASCVAFEICQFNSSKECYKNSLNKLLGSKLQLEAKERDLQTRLELPTSSWELQSFIKFKEGVETILQVWDKFSGTIIPYYLHKHKEMLVSTDATFRRLRDSSKELLSKAESLQEGGLKVEVSSEQGLCIELAQPFSIEKVELVRMNLQF